MRLTSTPMTTAFTTTTMLKSASNFIHLSKARDRVCSCISMNRSCSAMSVLKLFTLALPCSRLTTTCGASASGSARQRSGPSSAWVSSRHRTVSTRFDLILSRREFTCWRPCITLSTSNGCTVLLFQIKPSMKSSTLIRPKPLMDSTSLKTVLMSSTLTPASSKRRSNVPSVVLIAAIQVALERLPIATDTRFLDWVPLKSTTSLSSSHWSKHPRESMGVATSPSISRHLAVRTSCKLRNARWLFMTSVLSSQFLSRRVIAMAEVSITAIIRFSTPMEATATKAAKRISTPPPRYSALSKRSSWAPSYVATCTCDSMVFHRSPQ
mmetsp:Transcript_120163/g.340129  ORF Transcript_120163/g.340129 Transcript_120163/m.340129 type:complete len:324 (+) Transcript_120163:2000-2971(+)